RKRGFATRLIGVDANPTHAEQALSLGLVDEILPLDEAVKAADLALLAVPVNVARELLPHILNLLKEDATVVDMGSTKNGICTVARSHSRRAQYVASHPMAGTEYSGPAAAVDGLFDGKKVIVCEHSLSADFALNRALSMYRSLNMEALFYTNAEAHDRHVAYVSHISHVSSFMLGLTVLEVEKSEKHIFDLAGTGFESTVRLAKSAPATWTPIFLQNADSVSHALEKYIANLHRFKACIDERNADGVAALIAEANKIAKIIT
ncbi:MAG: prephenate dehydrogenase/arogenate dehydrogenase family protein, partial [Prevotellaceae bacterium]|nr:prephenate dehydrogenase/arogenate dehydrogenase family protein [Prevotellaceae bacterium]